MPSRRLLEPATRPIGVTVASVVMGLTAVPELLWALFLLVTMLRGAHAWNWLDVREALLSLWLAALSAGTARGLRDLSPWAVSLALWTGVQVGACGLLLAEAAARQCMQAPGASLAGSLRQGPVHGTSLWIALPMVVLSGWWCVYFSLKSVRWSFIEADAERRIGMR